MTWDAESQRAQDRSGRAADRAHTCSVHGNGWRFPRPRHGGRRLDAVVESFAALPRRRLTTLDEATALADLEALA
ncbi:hypothetical protein ACWCQW_12270 [Streptomyces mirabilis]